MPDVAYIINGNPDGSKNMEDGLMPINYVIY